jgi:hypothetical protein
MVIWNAMVLKLDVVLDEIFGNRIINHSCYPDNTLVLSNGDKTLSSST